MRAFVFFTPNICNIGGAELYISNKISRLKERGFDVFVFSFVKGEIALINLVEYSHYIFPCLRLNPVIYTKHYRNCISNKIIKIIKPTHYSDIFVESTEINSSLWAELVSSKIGSKHIFMDLQEEHHYSERIKEYLLFKYKHFSLFGINKESIASIFELKQESMEERFITAECIGGVSKSISYDFGFNDEKYDFVIGSIGRLEKPSSSKSIADFANYCGRHSSYNFLLFLIGDGNTECKTNITGIFKQLDNVKVVITGYLSPVPYNLIHRINCFFSSAGSSRLTEKENIPTISIDVINGKAIGILNYTTIDTLYSDHRLDNNDDLGHYLDLVLFENYCSKNKKIQKDLLDDIDFSKEFERQLSFYNNVPANSFFPQKKMGERGIKWFLYKIFSFLLTGAVFSRFQYYLHKKRRIK